VGSVGRSFRREISLLLFGLGLASALTLALVSQAGAASGTWDRAWGKNVNGGGVFGVCTVASSCLAGTSGGLGGEFNTPEDVAADGAGNSYVADQNRIQKFDSSGAWLRTWGKNVNGGGVFEVCTVASSCLTGGSGGLGGEMNFPSSVATDPSGNVYVADFLNQRIQKFNSSGVWERAWGKGVDNGGGTGFEVCANAANCLQGTTGGLGGEMNAPTRVAADASGNVYVTDATNQRIQKFNSSGVWERAWGRNVVKDGGAGQVCTDAQAGNAATLCFEVCTVAADCQQGSTGGLGGELSGPSKLATDGSGFVYVVDQNRVQQFAASTGAWQRAWGKDVIQLGQPGDGGAVFEICTTAAHCQGGSSGGLGGEMNGPLGVATDASGNVYVADATNHRIQKFDSSGSWQRAWGKNVNGGGVFGVCTVASSCLVGTPGVLGGEMGTPRGVATDASGNLYVAEFSNRRIQKFVDPVVVPPVISPPAATTAAPTGQRAAAIKKCKKKFPKGPKRKKCVRKAKRLPV
jgi:tripartite motif-containing protein 71